MASSGPNSPGTAADDSAVGTLTWSNPSNGTTSNNSYASIDNGSSFSSQSHYLKWTGFGFAIDSGATIDGIVLEVERKANGSSPGWLRDTVVKLVKGGSVVGSNYGATTTDWPTTEAFATYGGAADLWGTTWTAAEVNAADFGAVLQIGFGLVTGLTASVDSARVTVYYTAGASGGVGPVLSGKVTSEGRIFGGSVLKC